jgi:hypothetical protein
MNAETTVGPIRKASGWSMLWGILMIVCGILAISLPLASSIGVVILLAWLILFAGVSHLIFAFHSHSVGGFLWQVLLALIYGAAAIYMLMNPRFERALSNTGSSGVSSRRRNLGVGSLLPYPRGPARRVDFIRRYRYTDSWDFNLGALAIECRLADRNIGGN